MFNARSFLLLLFLICTATLLAQTLVIPHPIDDKVEGKKQSQNINFYQYPYLSEEIDLRSFKKSFPKLEAPDFITIQAPDLSEFKTTTVFLGLLTGRRMDTNALVIWIAGNYFSNEVTFFIDHTMDRNFRNDGAPIVLKAGRTPQSIVIYPSEDPNDAFELLLHVPKNRKFNNFGALSGQKTKIINQFSFGFHAGFGAGNLQFQFDNLEKGFPTWYTVNNSEKNIGLSFSYSLPRFRFGLSATLQNHFYYTSYLNIRVDNPIIRVDPNTGQRLKIENVQVERNQDIHARNRIQWGLTAAYRWHLGESTEIQPIIGVGKTTHLSGEYIADRTDDQEVFKLPASSFFETGIQFEFTTGLHKAFFIGLVYNRIWWEPEGYFDTFLHENLKTKYKTWKGQLGYRIAL